MAAAENLYTTNPEIKVFLTAHNGLALGINNYFTGIGSPVTDYTGMGIFCVNGNETHAELIKAETPFRGMVLTGGGAAMTELDRRIGQALGIPCRVADAPEGCAIRGLYRIMENPEAYRAMLMDRQSRKVW